MNPVTQESLYVYTMQSRTDPNVRHIIKHEPTDDRLICDCKGFEYKSNCYHVRDVREFISLKRPTKTMIRETSKEPEHIKQLKAKSDGEYRDNHAQPVLVETDKIDGRTKRLYAMSLDPAVEGLWIPRVELSTQERKRIIKDVLHMEKDIWIGSQQKQTEDIDWLSDSDLFRYYKMMNELVGNDITA